MIRTRKDDRPHAALCRGLPGVRVRVRVVFLPLCLCFCICVCVCVCSTVAALLYVWLKLGGALCARVFLSACLVRVRNCCMDPCVYTAVAWMSVCRSRLRWRAAAAVSVVSRLVSFPKSPRIHPYMVTSARHNDIFAC